VSRYYLHPSGVIRPKIIKGCEAKVRPLVVIDPAENPYRPNSAAWADWIEEQYAEQTKPAEPTDPAVRVWANGSEWAKCGPWWVTPAVNEVPREWDYLVESVGFEILA